MNEAKQPEQQKKKDERSDFIDLLNKTALELYMHNRAGKHRDTKPEVAVQEAFAEAAAFTAGAAKVAAEFEATGKLPQPVVPIKNPIVDYHVWEHDERSNQVQPAFNADRTPKMAKGYGDFDSYCPNQNIAHPDNAKHVAARKLHDRLPIWEEQPVWDAETGKINLAAPKAYVPSVN